MGAQVNSAKPRPTTSRHLRWESFESRIRDGVPSIEPVGGSPRVWLFITRGGRSIGARFFAAARTGNISSPLAEIAIRKAGSGINATLEISTGNPSLFQDFYAFCCTVADRVQLDHESIEHALRTTLSSWAALLRRKALLSESAQVGLFAELTFLKRIASVIGWTSAVDCWQGPQFEEHDFTLPYVDVEVKATRSERRVHQITSLTQLVPKNNRRLVIVSVQLTPGKGRESLSLPQLISTVLSEAMAAGPSNAELIRHRITRLGWLDEDAGEYDTQYFLRAPMVVVPVDSTCPAIVPATLASLGNTRTRIEDVVYSIDLDGLGVRDEDKRFDQLLFRR